MKLIKLGLLSLRDTSLEKEITKLTEKIELSRKGVKELPSEVERMEAYLRDMIEDRKTLETILAERR
jgi:archaellum component FlaC